MKATTWAGLMAANVTGPAPIGIIGVGGLGTLAVQFAKGLGHRVVAIDNRSEGRALATEFGLKADLVIDSGKSDAVEEIKNWAGKDGLAAVIVCTDNVDITEWSLNTLRPHGVAVPLGLPPDGFKFSAFTMIFNELTIKGSLVATRGQVEDMMQVVAEHQIRSHITTIGFDGHSRASRDVLEFRIEGQARSESGFLDILDTTFRMLSRNLEGLSLAGILRDMLLRVGS